MYNLQSIYDIAENMFCLNHLVMFLQLTTHEFLLGAIPGLEFLFRPSMAAASASGDAQDPFFYAQVSQCVL